MKALTFLEYYKLVKFLFDVEWLNFRDEMESEERQDFLMEMDFSLSPFQEWMN